MRGKGQANFIPFYLGGGMIGDCEQKCEQRCRNPPENVVAESPCVVR